jgi:hypothetical protein
VSQSLHLRRLQALLELDTLSDGDRQAFGELMGRLEANRRATLDDDEIAAVWRACERRFGHELVSRGLIDEGAPVPTPAVLRHLPLRPPTKRPAGQAL